MFGIKLRPTCPVCDAECSINATTCKTCGFEDKLGIVAQWATIEDAQEWLESVVKPFRMKWELQAMTKQLVGTSAKIARLETQLKVAMEALKSWV